MASIGMKNCIKVNASRSGSLDPKDLEKKIEDSIKAGKTPFMISATSGSTVMGGFDDLVAIGAIAKKFNIWLHVDACWGTTSFFSDKTRHLIKGIENADSCILDPHKGLGLPL